MRTPRPVRVACSGVCSAESMIGIENYVSEQLLLFLRSIGLGLCLGLLYDLLGALRGLGGKVWGGVMDALFCLTAAVSVLFFILAGDGELRIFIALGVVGGAVLFWCLLGRILRPVWVFWLELILLPALAVAAFFVLNKNMFGKEYPKEAAFSKKTVLIACAASFLVGGYDGFYGPGTGTFLIIALNVFAHLNLKSANAQTKIINLTTNFTSLIVFIANGQIVWKLGLAAMACGIAGNYIGSFLALRKGSKITRPVILAVLALLCIKMALL